MNKRTLAQLVEDLEARWRYDEHFGTRKDGRWECLSSEAFFTGLREIGLGLHAQGVRQGECIGVMGPPSHHWLMIDLALMSMGAVTVPLFPMMAPENFRFQLQNSGIQRLFLLSNAAEAFTAAHAPELAHCYTRHAVPEPSIEQLRAEGRALHAEKPQLWQLLTERAQPEDIATIVYTSGSTGVPKGVELTHQGMLQQIGDLMELFPLKGAENSMLAGLPLAHVLSRMIIYSTMSLGLPTYLIEEIADLAVACREKSPTCSIAVPRLLEKIFLSMKAQIVELGGIKSKLGLWALDVARRPEIRGWRRLVFPLLDALVYRKLRAALGGRLKVVGCGAAPLDPKLGGFFWNIGIDIYQGYGSSEACSGISVNSLSRNKLGTVGRAYPSYELRLSEQGEVLARGPSLMRGYHKAPEATAEVIDADGWYHTGDLGEIDAEGFLTITGRIKEIMKTSGGKMISPVPIEHALSDSPLVDMAMIVADGRKCVGALLFPDAKELERYKRRHKLKGLRDDEILNSTAFKNDTLAFLKRVNAKFNTWEHVHKFRWITDSLSVEKGELTPTLKIRRNAVERNFETLIDEMFEA